MRLARRVDRDFVRVGLKINAPKYSPVFVVDFEDEGKLQVPGDRFEALKASMEENMSSRHGRVQARSLASATGKVHSMHLS